MTHTSHMTEGTAVTLLRIGSEILITLAVSTPLTAAPVPREKLPEPLPPAITEAWEKAGAEVGWMNAKGEFYINESSCR